MCCPRDIGISVRRTTEVPWARSAAPIIRYGVINEDVPSPLVTIASITDGTSNTMIFSENKLNLPRNGMLLPWNSFDLFFAADRPPNYPTPSKTAVSSRHPGGVNAGFADGSVHFIKSTVNTCQLTQFGSIDSTWYTYTSSPDGSQSYKSFTSLARLGVWQALSTMANGEVISSDSY